MVQSPSFLLFPPSTHNVHFSLKISEQMHGPGRQQPLPIRWWWEGSGGIELPAQLPILPSWNSPFLRGPALLSLSSPHRWTWHCSSKCGPWNSSTDFTWELVGKAESHTPPYHPALLSQNLHINRTPRQFVYILHFLKVLFWKIWHMATPQSWLPKNSLQILFGAGPSCWKSRPIRPFSCLGKGSIMNKHNLINKHLLNDSFQE